MNELHLLRKVAAGSAVDVFLAGTPNGTVLVQLSRPQVAADPDTLGRFVDTTRSRAKAAKHPGLLSVEEAHCSAEGRFVLVSGQVCGRTAADHLREQGPVSGREVRRWALALCDALDFLHEHGLVHGFLSPANVFLDGDRVRLLDTSLLLFRGPRSLPVVAPPVAPEYLSPERCSGQRGTRASDVYGLGVLIHELLTGVPPFTSEELGHVRKLHLTAPLPPLFPGLEEWTPLLRGCLAKDPAARPTLRALKQQLQHVVALDTPAIIDEPAVEPPVLDEIEMITLHPVGVELGPEDVMELELREGELALRSALEAGGEATPALPIDVQVSAVSPVQTRAVPPPLPPAREPEPKVGDVIGRYRLERLLGEGGMGQVFEATHLSLNRRVALKLLRRELVGIDSQLKRFIAEAQAVNRVKHPNLIAVEDLVQEGDRVFFVMELLQGQSLKVMGREAPIELRRVLRFMRQAAEALSAAHQVGVVHRDLKPDNLMVVRDVEGREQLKVVDFGVARIRDLPPSIAYKTQVGQVVGTPLWMAPEQVLGHEVDARGDVYSLAMVAYVLLTRRFPFPGDLSQVVMSRLQREALPVGEHSFLGEQLPRDLQNLLAQALSRDRGQRPQSMEHFARVLAALESRTFGQPATPVAAKPWWRRWS